MIDVIDVLKEWDDGSGVACAKLFMQVSTADDLPKIGDVVECKKVQAGSIAQIVQANTFVTLDDDTTDGTWYPQQS